MKFIKSYTIFQFVCLIYFFTFMVTASPILPPSPKFNPENIETSPKAASQTPLSSPSIAVATFTNPTNISTAVTGRIEFTKISLNKTHVSGQLNSGIFDTVVENYQFKIIDRSKTLLYDLTADGLNKWSVNVNESGTTPFEYDFDNLSISKIVDQFFEISHHKKGIVGMTMIKAI
ncbi:hypothetical protein C1645_758206 [Glomus cerebriforme]|uniref:Uncharacterized protein n=1 Tax=Glomus cerebriforme TaxID=658196 RepID=A0A397TA16_9GLOM|nr:hypothetical protein C1645_758206 [Glomus cerebriforme]